MPADKRTWLSLTKPQRTSLLELLASDPNPHDASCYFISYRALVTKGLASAHWVHNQFKLTPEGRALAEFSRSYESRETTTQRQQRLYDDAMNGTVNA